MSRLKYTAKNIVWGYVAQISSLLIKFISRTVFIYTLGETYLGVSGLFTSVLGLLSFTELGIGTAMNFSLYKPIAENDREKIKSLMQFYKAAYRVIAAVIMGLGLCLLPFLRFIIDDPGNIGNIYIYYMLYLLDTSFSYLVTYKYSLPNAEQKSYIMSNVNMVWSFITTLAQIIVLLVFHNFLVYLVTQVVCGVCSKLFNAVYLNRKYPMLNEPAEKLSKEDLASIKKNVIALIIHKLGDVVVNQTDNILISAFVSVTVVGYLSNYNMVITSVGAFVTVIFSSAVASLGNLVASSTPEYEYKIFSVYRFVGFWLYGFCSIAFYVLLTPFITIWAGKSWILEEAAVALICLEYYNKGHRVCLNNFKTAAGIFNQDKWVAFGQAIINLIVSVAAVKLIGLPGIFVGTVISGLFSTAIKPQIVYKAVLHIKPIYYYIDSVKYLCVYLVPCIFCRIAKNLIIPGQVTYMNFIVLMLIVAIIPNVFFLIVFRKNANFQYLLDILRKKTRSGNTWKKG